MRIISCVIKIKKCLLQIMPEWHRWSRSPGIRCCWTATTATAAGQDWFDRVARIIQCSVPCPCAPDIPVVNPAPPRVQMPPRHLPLRECVAGGGGGGGGGARGPPHPPPQSAAPVGAGRGGGGGGAGAAHGHSQPHAQSSSPRARDAGASGVRAATRERGCESASAGGGARVWTPRARSMSSGCSHEMSHPAWTGRRAEPCRATPPNLLDPTSLCFKCP
jgi:hypothetical protein